MRGGTVRCVVLSFCLMCVMFVLADSGNAGRRDSLRTGLVAHEWGTFTSIAGRNGKAMEWSPAGVPADLPRFVEHFRTADFKGGLRGTVRMETPVLYFYSPSETTVSVKVSFAQGIITEWYPHASHTEPNAKNVLSPTSLLEGERRGSIAWDSVTVSPGISADLPRDNSENHYYTARETGSAPIGVKTRKSVQQEKFLFYRGVAAFSIPLVAQSLPGGKVLVRNLGMEEIPEIILFERRGEKLGYRIGGAVWGEVELDAPELSSSAESIESDLEAVLIARGLYPDEAHAMIETWKGSWFEEGSRLFYIVPPGFVNKVLPLSIEPAPTEINRVFVGRLELITLATEREVESALTRHDRSVLRTYGRFLEAILDQLHRQNPDRAGQMDQNLAEIYGAVSDPAAK